MDSEKNENKSDISSNINSYVSTLNEKEKHALSIAEKNLQSSFDLRKSIGFIRFQDTNKDK